MSSCTNASNIYNVNISLFDFPSLSSLDLLTISILLSILLTSLTSCSFPVLSSFLPRCRELVERDGVDVTRADNEGITVLHWAAINNRIPVASYIIQKGADVNAVGGELRSTPIHWAAR